MTEPSDLELEVLKAFWRGGAMSAREAQTVIEPELGWSASTTRTVLERMVAKGKDPALYGALSWRGTSATRLMVLLADAPPRFALASDHQGHHGCRVVEISNDHRPVVWRFFLGVAHQQNRLDVFKGY